MQKAWIGVGYNKREQAKEAAKDLTTRFEKDRQKVLHDVSNRFTADPKWREKYNTGAHRKMAALDKAEKETLARQMEEADRDIAAVTLLRPAAAQVLDVGEGAGRGGSADRGRAGGSAGELRAGSGDHRKRERDHRTVASRRVTLSSLSGICVKLPIGSGSPRCCELPSHPVS